MTNTNNIEQLLEEKVIADVSLKKIHFKRLKKGIISIVESKFLYEQYFKTNDGMVFEIFRSS